MIANIDNKIPRCLIHASICMHICMHLCMHYQRSKVNIKFNSGKYMSFSECILYENKSTLIFRYLRTIQGVPKVHSSSVDRWLRYGIV